MGSQTIRHYSPFAKIPRILQEVHVKGSELNALMVSSSGSGVGFRVDRRATTPPRPTTSVGRERNRHDCGRVGRKMLEFHTINMHSACLCAH